MFPAKVAMGLCEASDKGDLCSVPPPGMSQADLRAVWTVPAYCSDPSNPAICLPAQRARLLLGRVFLLCAGYSGKYGEEAPEGGDSGRIHDQVRGCGRSNMERTFDPAARGVCSLGFTFSRKCFELLPHLETWTQTCLLGPWAW